MTTSDPVPSNRAWLEKYTNALLASADVADRLKVDCLPTKQDRFFRIEDGETIAKLELPLALRSYTLASLILHFYADYTPEVPVLDTDVLFECDEGDGMTSWSSAHDGYHEITFVDAGTTLPRTDPDGIRSSELSNLVARAVRPYDDPSHSQYTDLTSRTVLEDIDMVLADNDRATRTSVTTYEVEDYEIVCSEENGRLIEVGITKTIEGTDRFALAARFSFAPTQHLIGVFKIEDGTKIPLDATPQEVEAFADALEHITEELNERRARTTEAVSLDEFAEVKLREEGLATRTLPEERSSDNLN
ncbi:MAG TPA: hypothetical protein VL362_01570 [Patescibacteria group bacterium]|jgi:hypothetical protein|nr:hypothetical protein [Patescibacteria group bacterium]